MIARSIHRKLPASIDLQDLVSEGVLGLISAIDHYDPTLNLQLKTYAEHKIRGAILESLRQLDWAPRGRRRLDHRIAVARRTIQQRLARTATEEEIAAELQLPLAEYRILLVHLQGLDLQSLDLNVDPSHSPHKDQPPGSILPDQALPSPAEALEHQQFADVLHESICGIPQPERDVFALYYGDGLTVPEIARATGGDATQIAHLKRRAVSRLRADVTNQWPHGRDADTSLAALGNILELADINLHEMSIVR